MDFLFKNQTHFFNSNYFRVAIYFLTAILFAHFAGLSAPDDGLRHIAFAAHQNIMHSWGEVFPHSLFFKEYDPWFVWHKIIAFYLLFFSYDTVHVAINTTVLFLFMLLLDKLLVTFSDFKKTPLLLFIIISITLLSSSKYINIRPDLLSGLFLMTALLLTKKPYLLFLLTVLYAPSYYLFFLYTGSMGLLYIALKNYKALTALFLGSLLGLAWHLYNGGEFYLQTLDYILHDRTLREGLEVTEGMTYFAILGKLNYPLLVISIWSAAGFLLYKYYSYFKQQPIALLLLIMSPLWLGQMRYTLLLQALFLLYLFSESKIILHFLFSRKILYYLYKFVHILKSVQYKIVFIIPALFYTIFMYALLFQDYDHTKSIQEKNYFKNKTFTNQTILINGLVGDIYDALYLNPTLKFVPSCSIGWFEENKKMKDIYIRMMKEEGINEKELNALLVFTGAKYYFHRLANKKQILSLKKLNTFGIKPILIIDNKILFQKETDE